MYRKIIYLFSLLLISKIVFADELLKVHPINNESPYSSKIAMAEAEKADEVFRWMDSYYKSPNFNIMVSETNELMNSGLFIVSQKTWNYTVLPVATFYAEIFKANPNKITEIMSKINFQNNMQRKAMYQAIWDSDTNEGRVYLQQQKNTSDQELAKMIDEIIAIKPFNPLTAQLNELTLDRMWAAYNASGNKKIIMRFINILNWTKPSLSILSNALQMDRQLTPIEAEKIILMKTVRWALISNANRDMQVRKICDEYIKTHQNTEARKILMEQLDADKDVLYVNNIKENTRFWDLTKNLRIKKILHTNKILVFNDNGVASLILENKLQ